MNPRCKIAIFVFCGFVALVMLAAVGAIISPIFRAKRSESGLALRTVSRNELEFRNGKLLEQGVPFTGIAVEHGVDGQLQSRSTISNGLLEGLSERWHSNGTLQASEHFAGGVSDGVRTKYHPNGKKLSEATIVHGELHGLFERWHENGRLAEQVHLERGVAEGESVSFHPDGSLKARVLLKNGRVVTQQFSNLGEQTETRHTHARAIRP